MVPRFSTTRIDSYTVYEMAKICDAWEKQINEIFSSIGLKGQTMGCEASFVPIFEHSAIEYTDVNIEFQIMNRYDDGRMTSYTILHDYNEDGRWTGTYSVITNHHTGNEWTEPETLAEGLDSLEDAVAFIRDLKMKEI